MIMNSFLGFIMINSLLLQGAYGQTGLSDPNINKIRHYRMAEVLAVKLKILTQHISISKISRRCINSTKKVSNTFPDEHFRLFYNIIQNANMDLLEREVQIVAQEFLTNSNLLPNSASTFRHSSSPTMSKQCLHAIADYSQRLVAWYASRRTRLRRVCFPSSLHNVCDIILSSCGCHSISS